MVLSGTNIQNIYFYLPHSDTPFVSHHSHIFLLQCIELLSCNWMMYFLNKRLNRRVTEIFQCNLDLITLFSFLVNASIAGHQVKETSLLVQHNAPDKNVSDNRDDRRQSNNILTPVCKLIDGWQVGNSNVFWKQAGTWMWRVALPRINHKYFRRLWKVFVRFCCHLVVKLINLTCVKQGYGSIAFLKWDSNANVGYYHGSLVKLCRRGLLMKQLKTFICVTYNNSFFIQLSEPWQTHHQWVSFFFFFQVLNLPLVRSTCAWCAPAFIGCSWLLFSGRSSA